MDAISLLTKDHETVSKLFREHERADDAKKAGLFERIRGELEVHAQVEERIFYPALRRAQGPALAVQVGEAVREHQDVKSLLRSMSGLQAGNLDYDAKFRQIVQNVEHHVQEEQGQMFPQARTLLGEDRLRTLGAEMMALKQTLSVGGAVPRALQAVGAMGGAIRRAVGALRSRARRKRAAPAPAPRTATVASTAGRSTRTRRRPAASGRAKTRVAAAKPRAAAVKKRAAASARSTAASRPKATRRRPSTSRARRSGR